MITKNQFTFLLGGHDLEMAEIRKIFSERAIPYHDRNLSWNNANLSAYTDVLNNDEHFAGIELKSDIAPPANYLLIDHHNEYADKPSAIEQVAQLLGIELIREQQLIAANDKGYIPAMEAFGATPKEIEEIRHRDREAQGVTDEDEQLAEQSIKENLSTEKGITVVKSLTSKFSAITDRLYPCNQLLIYTKDELNYYGKDAKKLALAFTDLIKENKAYSGGEGEGFFGLTYAGIIYLKGTEPAKNKLIETLTTETNP